MNWRARFRLRRAVGASRRRLLASLAGARDVTFIRSYGNVGDNLIYAGTRRLLADIAYREMSVRSVPDLRGETAILSGGGAWCQPFHEVLPDALHEIEQRFERVVVFPSSFDISVPRVREVLSASKALVFARERVSYQQIRMLCRAEIAHDCAFFFDFRPYQVACHGHLRAYRTDRESCQNSLPPDNNDISVTCESLDQWLWTIARCQTVETDRAHVTIAAALLGKRVRYRSSCYHKIPAIVAHSLGGFPVFRADEAS